MEWGRRKAGQQRAIPNRQEGQESPPWEEVENPEKDEPEKERLNPEQDPPRLRVGIPQEITLCCTCATTGQPQQGRNDNVGCSGREGSRPRALEHLCSHMMCRMSKVLTFTWRGIEKDSELRAQAPPWMAMVRGQVTDGVCG